MPKMKRHEIPDGRREPPALTIDGRFDQLVSLAVGLAEERLLDKTASNQLVAEIIRYGSQKERLTREKLISENEMLKAKAQAYRNSENMTKLVEDAMKAMNHYRGLDNDDEEETEDEGDEY